MKLDKAIKILNQLTKETLPITDLDTLDAVMLGREALIRLQYSRKFTYTCSGTLLPGETKT